MAMKLASLSSSHWSQAGFMLWYLASLQCWVLVLAHSLAAKNRMRVFSLCSCILLLLMGLFLLLDGGPALALAPAESITTQEFWQRVDQTITTLRGLRSKPKETVVPALDTLADQWSRLDALTLPS